MLRIVTGQECDGGAGATDYSNIPLHPTMEVKTHQNRPEYQFSHFAVISVCKST